MIEDIDVSKIHLIPSWREQKLSKPDTLKFVYNGCEVKLKRRVGERWNVVLDITIGGQMLQYNHEPSKKQIELWYEIDRKLFSLKEAENNLERKRIYALFQKQK